MKNLKICLFTMFILTTISCSDKNVIKCFKNNKIAYLPWMKEPIDRLGTKFTRISLYNYRQEQFIAFENRLDSGPAGSIYNCGGIGINFLNIGYNQFYDEAKCIDRIEDITNFKK